jgi:hypothetical protein
MHRTLGNNIVYRFMFKLFCEVCLVAGPHLGPMTWFLLLSDICDLHVEGRPIWREDGSVIYSYNSQSLSGPSPAELTTIFYCLIRDSLNLEGHVPVFISPRNRVAQLYPRALGSLSVVFYDTQGYSRGILSRLNTGHSILLDAPSCSLVEV